MFFSFLLCCVCVECNEEYLPVRSNSSRHPTVLHIATTLCVLPSSVEIGFFSLYSALYNGPRVKVQLQPISRPRVLVKVLVSRSDTLRYASQFTAHLQESFGNHKPLNSRYLKVAELTKCPFLVYLVWHVLVTAAWLQAKPRTERPFTVRTPPLFSSTPLVWCFSTTGQKEKKRIQANTGRLLVTDSPPWHRLFTCLLALVTNLNLMSGCEGWIRVKYMQSEVVLI